MFFMKHTSIAKSNYLSGMRDFKGHVGKARAINAKCLIVCDDRFWHSVLLFWSIVVKVLIGF